MCGIAAIAGRGWRREQLAAMIERQRHRGPDDQGIHIGPSALCGLGHARLNIIDLSPRGAQPMASADGRLWIAFNGEVYNHVELRRELGDYPFKSRTDTEVVLAAFARWGADALSRLIGMFGFVVWDEATRTLFGARDRFGVKPLYFHRSAERITIASEIKSLWAAGVPATADPHAWADYLVSGLYDQGPRTFWRDIEQLPPGHAFRWTPDGFHAWCWYDLAEATGDDLDARDAREVREEYTALLEDSVRLRFRSDVPVGINLSGGLDSSTLLALVQRVRGPESDLKAYTFATGDPAYDETPWVRQMLASTQHPSIVCALAPADVPRLAEDVQRSQDEPFGGLPTLAYARVFERARADGVVVLLDGQGMDEQWAGYDYYRGPLAATTSIRLQGAADPAVHPECLAPELRALAVPEDARRPFPDPLRNAQYRDARWTKIPRALRFNDRISMRSSVELREPFLDHRLFELALRQPPERKIAEGTGKWMLREIARTLVPSGIVEAPKRAMQTPQREWLRGPLRGWADGWIEAALTGSTAGWFEAARVRAVWRAFCAGQSDNSFYVWQWISAGMLLHGVGAAAVEVST